MRRRTWLLGTVLGLDTRRTLFGSDHGPNRENNFLDPTAEAAKIRSATLTGVPLYLLPGYREVERVEVSLNNGDILPVVKMVK